MFETLKALSPDPILGLMAAYRADPNPKKVDLGVGVYKDETGNTPILETVKQGEALYRAAETSKTYVGPPGDPDFDRGMEQLIFGADHPALKADRLRTVQAPGGCGALRVAAATLNRAAPGAAIWVPDPTWANHVPLLGDAGLTIKTYPYYDGAKQGLKAEEMLATFKQLKAGDLVLLHGCCHNPCGVDLSPEHWDAVAALAVERGFTPFVDLAYLGLGNGLEQDAYGVRKLAASVPEMILASSCSKNFGLYRERVGALTVLGRNTAEAEIAWGQVQNVARGIYSMPPNYGGAIVGRILNDAKLSAAWREELSAMRDRINGLRDQLTQKFAAKLGSNRFDFIRRQLGMFSFLGLSKEQVATLKERYSIYMVDSSRINVAGVNSKNIDYFVDAVCSVL